MNGKTVEFKKPQRMPEFFSNHISAFCRRVKNGSVLEIVPIQTQYVRECQTIIHNYGLCVYAEPKEEGWVYLWIYKQSFHGWVLKRLFGYSEAAIQELRRSNPGVYQFPSGSPNV
jgi:hypothetical protein